MSERARTSSRPTFPRIRSYGASASETEETSWLLSSESLLRFLLSFVLAIALWLYVTAKQDPTVAWEYAEPIPVAVQGLRHGLTLTNNVASIRVRLRVDNRNIPVSTTSFHPFVDLTGLRPGVYQNVPIHAFADPGIRVVRLIPSHLAIVVEALQSRHVPVHWKVLSPPPGGYDLGNISIDPSTVTVSGPESTVSQIFDARVYIDLSQTRYSIDGFYKPSPETAEGNTIGPSGHITLDPGQVHVNVPVRAVRGYRSVPILSPLVGEPRVGFGVVSLQVQPSEVTAYGPPSLLARLVTVETEPLVLDHHSSGTFSRRLSIRVPPGITVNRTWVKVSAQVASVNASSSIPIGVTPLHLVPGLVARMRPASALVTVVGPASGLQSAASQMRVTVNLSGFSAGTYSVKPRIQVPKNLRVESVYPSTFQVVVKSSSG